MKAWLFLIFNISFCFACPFSDYFQEPEKLCPDFKELKSKKIYFLFEGAGGYAPLQALAIKNRLYDRYQNKNQFIEACQSTCVKDKCKKAAHDLFNQVENISFPFALRHLRPKLSDENEVVYFSQKHRSESQACLIKLHEDNQLSGEKLDIRLIGYSMGAYQAIELARFAEEKNISLTAGISIDPVGQGPLLIPSVIGKRNLIKLIKRKFSIPWINFYQKLDKTSMKVGIKGHSVPHAHFNKKMNDFMGEEKKGHVKISSHPEIQNAMNLFQELF
jgi:hypothetical protein